MIPSALSLFVPSAVPGTSSLEAATTKGLWKPHWHPSIFSKLLAIMLGTLTVLLAMVTVIFALVIFPASASTSEHATRQYTQLLAASQPSFEAARTIHKEIGLDVRYEGPDGSWATSDRLPTIDQVRRQPVHSSFAHGYHLAAASNGGTYLFVWDVRNELRSAHVKLLGMLLLMIVGVVLTGYFQFEPVSGKLGALPLPKAALRAALAEMISSPDTREQLRLPPNLADLRVENSHVVVTYR